MKKEELFEGAIVLARRSIYERRSRWRVLEIGDQCAKVKKDNITFYENIRHLKPAKITPKVLKELGFKEVQTHCAKIGKVFCRKYIHEGPEDIKIILKEDCDIWGSTRAFVGGELFKVSYVHRVQTMISVINEWGQQNKK